ncbi:MAG: deoxyribonuclease IV [Gemmatimonas sp.]|nr:deoxyribonuclease IV [Gemmatimonas sp.]
MVPRKRAAAKKHAAKKPAGKSVAAKKPAAKKPAAKRPAFSGTRPTSTRAVSVPKPGTVPASAGASPYDIPYTGAPLGAHVSTSGGVATAPPRGVDIGATAIQLFTKQANQWKERLFDEAEVAAFRQALAATPVAFTNAHDSYLINLASPNPDLRAKSITSFEYEMRRGNALGLDAVVSHPGNFMDDRASGIARNADAIIDVLERVTGPTRLLMELTAGQGTVIGSTFEEMAALLARLPAALQVRVGVCLDTAHVFAAGYDLVNDFDGVMARFGDVLGFHRLGMLHLNDSKAPLGSKKDRHELIGAGFIGDGAFRRIMTEPRLAAIPKSLETPKGDDLVSNDRAMLRKLRAFARGERAPERAGPGAMPAPRHRIRT